LFDYPAFAALIKSKRGALKWSQESLATETFGDPARKGDISKFENARKRPNETTIQRLCTTLAISDAEMAPIRLGRPTSKQLDQIPTLSRDQLELLASRFDIDGAHSKRDEDLRQLLTQKAEEHRNLKAEFANLAGLSTRIDNIRGAAEAALDDFDYDTANELLENAREIIRDQLAEPLRINATLAERQADIALIQNDPDRAFTLLMAAADGFAPLNPLEPSRKKFDYEDRLYAHGLRYGGNGLHCAIRMNRSAITDDLEHAEPYLWARCQNNLGIALKTQGTRTDGPAGTDLLTQSVTAYRAALTVYTRDAHPVEWAATQNNLGLALETQGSRTDGAAGTDLLTQSVTAYRAALTVYTRDDHPVQWAMTQENLAIAEASHATHPATTDPRPHLDAALTYIDAALTVYDPIDMSYDHGTATATRDRILAAITALD
jgi:transcriptional regulator with XRE-family HTH domain